MKSNQCGELPVGKFEPVLWPEQNILCPKCGHETAYIKSLGENVCPSCGRHCKPEQPETEKSFGIVKVNDLGSVYIPPEARAAAGIGLWEPLDITVRDGAIVLRKAERLNEMKCR